MDDSDKSVEIRRLSVLQDEFLRSLEPNRGLKSIHVFEGCVDLSKWLLCRWDREVTGKQDFVYVSDAHYKRSGFYVDYDSLLGLDYDDLIEALLGRNQSPNS